MQNPNNKTQKTNKYQIQKIKFFKHWNFNIWYCLLFVVCGLLFTTGCAKTVTTIVPYGDQMLVEVTLAGTMDINDNRYFLVLSDNANYTIPLPPPDLIEAAPEFIEPGLTPEMGTAEAYYTNFFTTWSSYIILDPAGYSVIMGPFVYNQENTREALSTIGEINNLITFSVDLDQVFTTVPNQIYFDFVAVPWPDGQAKIPADHLPSTDNYIDKTVGSIVQINDGLTSGIEDSLDILNCRIEIQ